jgi:hypothetical protein
MGPKRMNLTVEEKVAILVEYEKALAQGQRGTVVDLCVKYSVGRDYPARLKRAYDLEKTTNPTPSFARKSVSGRPSIMTNEKSAQLMEYAEHHSYDFTCEEAAHFLGISTSSVWRHMEKEGWRQVNKTLRPFLTTTHMSARLAFATKMHRFHFDLWIDIDEKWFYTVSTNGKRKVPPGVQPPRDAVQHKGHVPKVMALVAVARPVLEHNFHGVVGAWRVGEMRKAKKSSKKRKKGDAVFHDLTMDSKLFCDIMIEKVFPAVRQLFPWAPAVTIQMDGAPAHASNESTDRLNRSLRVTNSKCLPQIQLTFQPAQSPDCNVLDLCVFASLDKKVSKAQRGCSVWDKEKLWENVRKELENYPHEVLNAAFDTKIAVLKEIASHGGGNEFALPHKRN